MPMLFSVKSVSLFAAAMVFDTVGNILFKKGMRDISISTDSGWLRHWQTLKQVLASWIILLGATAMVLEAIIWLAFLSITPLNIAAPLSSANNIFILLASAWFLKEHVSNTRWVGVGFIVTGMLLVTGSTV
jgi:drug/metabolite transporter (DMT)-like permease